MVKERRTMVTKVTPGEPGEPLSGAGVGAPFITVCRDAKWIRFESETPSERSYLSDGPGQRDWRTLALLNLQCGAPALDRNPVRQSTSNSLVGSVESEASDD